MFINNLYSIGDPVYIKTDPDQERRLVAELKVLPNDLIVYLVSFGVICTECYDFELSKEKCFQL